MAQKFKLWTPWPSHRPILDSIHYISYFSSYIYIDTFVIQIKWDLVMTFVLNDYFLDLFINLFLQ